MQLTSTAHKELIERVLLLSIEEIAEFRAQYVCRAIKDVAYKAGVPELGTQLENEFVQLFTPTHPPEWLAFVGHSPATGYATYGFWGPVSLPDPRGKVSSVDNTFAREQRLTALGLFLAIINQQEIKPC